MKMSFSFLYKPQLWRRIEEAANLERDAKRETIDNNSVTSGLIGY